MSEPFETAPRDVRLFWAWDGTAKRWDLLRFATTGRWWATSNGTFWFFTAGAAYTHWAPAPHDPPAAP